ncbi:MAG: EutN/CcmL family microcompartment protein [Calditrichae bacterium]|nr:EutN/CcmL family microcompartment protein [Calditrichota bacterium]MCB9057419.1 EutN/CcmL family microcompartment protein [Calditrichia bacterium]
MIICKIIGDVVSTVKNRRLNGKKILIAQPLDLNGEPDGKEILVIDTVDAGAGDRVLVMREGGSARIVLQDNEIPVQAVIVAVVDDIDIVKEK